MTPEQILNIAGVDLAPHVHQALTERIAAAIEAAQTDAWHAASEHINAAMDDVERMSSRLHDTDPRLSIADVRRLANELARIAQGLEP